MNAPSQQDPFGPPSGMRSLRALPGSIWALGCVSLLMDISSELIHSLLPVFMSSVLGASMLTIGMIEGIAEATASVTRVFSGALSDYLGRRKLLLVVGYGLAAITKPVFPLATTIGWVFAARFVDRIGKGIRGAPRDALVADIAPRQLRGAAYGLRQALDTLGAFIGPLLAVLFMIWLAGDIKAVLWLAVIPAVLAVTVLVLAVREPAAAPREVAARNGLSLAAVRQLSLRYWLVVALGAVFTLARFSEAFLILRAQDVGLAIGYVPLIMVVMNAVYAAFAYPAGAASDALSPRTLLVSGLVVLIAADAVLALAASPVQAFIGAALWGLHMAFTQGLLSKLVADTAPAGLRGTAFGIFNLVSGGALLLASLIAGLLWSVYGAAATFVAGALFAAAAAAGLLLYRPGTHAAHSAGAGDRSDRQ
ncbi:MAG TPA: MFS transporter [Gammaproteobacteria bacterium]|nr:MFS transporter [Gammaproteobacteria bacterium]